MVDRERANSSTHHDMGAVIAGDPEINHQLVDLMPTADIMLS